MQQSRKTCVALYLEDEYNQLIMEAHFEYKRPNNPICNRPSFQCKFCKVCMKDKKHSVLPQNDELVLFLQGERPPKNVPNLEQE